MATIADATIRVGVRGADAALRSLRGLTRGALGGTAALGLGGLAGASLLVGGAVAKGVSSWVAFDRQMRNVQATTKQTDSSLRQAEETLRKTAIQTGKSQTDLAAALYAVNGAGIQGAAGIKLVQQAAVAAVAGQTDVATAADVLVGAMNAYGKSAGNAKTVSDTLFKAVDLGKLSFEELAAGLGTTVGIAGSVGVKLSEVAAAAAAITRKGVPAAQAFTGIRAAVTALQKPNKQLLDAFDQLGVKSGVTLIKQRGLAGAMAALRDNAIKQTGSVDEGTQALAAQLGTQEALIFVNQATGKSAKTYADILRGVESAAKGAGATQGAFRQQAKSTGVALDQAKQAIDVSLSRIGEVLAPQLAKVSKAIAAFVKENPQAVQTFAYDFAVAMTDAASAATGFARATLNALADVLDALGAFEGGQADVAEALHLPGADMFRRAAQGYHSMADEVQGWAAKVDAAQASVDALTNKIRDQRSEAQLQARATQLLGASQLEKAGGLKGLRKTAADLGIKDVQTYIQQLFAAKQAQNALNDSQGEGAKGFQGSKLAVQALATAQKNLSNVQETARDAAREAGLSIDDAGKAARRAGNEFANGVPKAKAVGDAVRTVKKAADETAANLPLVSASVGKLTKTGASYAQVLNDTYRAARLAGVGQTQATQAAYQALDAVTKGIPKQKAMNAAVGDAAASTHRSAQAYDAARQQLGKLKDDQVKAMDPQLAAVSIAKDMGASLQQAGAAGKRAADAFQNGVPKTKAIADAIGGVDFNAGNAGPRMTALGLSTETAGGKAQTAAGQVAGLRSQIDQLHDKTVTINVRSVSVGGGTNTGDSRSATPHRGHGAGLPGFSEGADVAAQAAADRLDRFSQALGDLRQKLASLPEDIDSARESLQSARDEVSRTQIALRTGSGKDKSTPREELAAGIAKRRLRAARGDLADLLGLRTTLPGRIAGRREQVGASRVANIAAQRNAARLGGNLERNALGVTIAQTRGADPLPALRKQLAELQRQENAAKAGSLARLRIQADREGVQAQISEAKDQRAADAKQKVADALQARADQESAQAQAVADAEEKYQAGVQAAAEAFQAARDAAEEAKPLNRLPALREHQKGEEAYAAALAKRTPQLDDDIAAAEQARNNANDYYQLLLSAGASSADLAAALNEATDAQDAWTKLTQGETAVVADKTEAESAALQAMLDDEKRRRYAAENSLAGSTAIDRFLSVLQSGGFGSAGSFGSFSVNSIWPPTPQQAAAMRRTVVGV